MQELNENAGNNFEPAEPPAPEPFAVEELAEEELAMKRKIQLTLLKIAKAKKEKEVADEKIRKIEEVCHKYMDCDDVELLRSEILKVLNS